MRRESTAVQFGRCYLKVMLERLLPYLGKDTLSSAQVGRLSSWGNKKHYEFFVPSSDTVPHNIRIELAADNAYHARAAGWEVLLAIIKGEPRSTAVSVLSISPVTHAWLEQLGKVQ